MDAQQPLNDLFARHNEAIRIALSHPARFAPWIVESATLLAYAKAYRSIAAGSTPNRAELLAWAVRHAMKLRRMAQPQLLASPRCIR